MQTGKSKIFRNFADIIYGKTRIKLPAPRFITFYNGKEKQPQRREMKLSDAYFTKEEEPSLELKVIQLNINPGYNEGLKKKCPTLYQYMQYVEKVRYYGKSLPLRQAVERAVDECIGEGILRDFLMHQLRTKNTPVHNEKGNQIWKIGRKKPIPYEDVSCKSVDYQENKARSFAYVSV